MRISARTQYALRAAAELAAAPPGPVPAERIAAAQGIPRRFLDSILLQLRRAGVLHSQRGPEGGYWLARPAGEINLAEIVAIVEGVPEGGGNGGYPGVARPLADVWSALHDHEEAMLSEITLAHVARDSLPGAPVNGTGEPAGGRGRREPGPPRRGAARGGPVPPDRLS
ncbi:RrF2 family transcriptional regulator [Planomonospora venezuelensis]|uniref:Rrf2 family protein n=1 Tax=Planomonospora venezuelensis TaxID=1999 RepID=A0A841DDA8_PLAVE|nr:Rrf2 family transcriptional regulator [Planomonospora venezuelensis]MBB5966085.1 Rrf2 family protein [Planomonospora venezuelensis]GIN03602.1 putative HTH-type transcriptional regulator [Planomonospora venezuelensis]